VDVSPLNLQAKEIGADPRGLLRLEATGLDLTTARIVWEADGEEPRFGNEFRPGTNASAPRGLEAEAQLPDGRRVFATGQRR